MSYSLQHSSCKLPMQARMYFVGQMYMVFWTESHKKILGRYQNIFKSIYILTNLINLREKLKHMSIALKLILLSLCQSVNILSYFRRFFRNIHDFQMVYPTILFCISFKISYYHCKLPSYHTFLFFVLRVWLILGSSRIFLFYSLAFLRVCFFLSLILFQLVAVDARRSSKSGCSPLSLSFLQCRCCALFFFFFFYTFRRAENVRRVWKGPILIPIILYCLSTILHDPFHAREKNRDSFF